MAWDIQMGGASSHSSINLAFCRSNFLELRKLCSVKRCLIETSEDDDACG